MDEYLTKIAFRAVVGLALAGVFFWQWRAREQRKRMSLTRKR